MEDPPQPQDMISSSLQLQLQIVDESSNPDDVPQKKQAAPPADEVCLDIPLNDPHQDMIINTRISKQQTTAPAETDGDDQEFIHRVPSYLHGDDQEFIRRVPSYLHGGKWNQPVSNVEKNERVYEPMVLSLGPYHHGKCQFQKMEEFKERVLENFISESKGEDAAKDRDYFYRAIVEKINKIRNNYEGVEKYTDEALSTIILRDACLLVNYMKDGIYFINEMMIPHVGMSMAILMDRDLYLLENQIPFWVIKHMLYLRYGKHGGDKLVCGHLSNECFLGDIQLRRLPWEDNEEEPRHFLDAYRKTLLKGEATDHDETTTKTKPHFLAKVFNICRKIGKTSSNNRSSQSQMNVYNCPYRSVTYLQAKGISFGPSSHSLTDVRFTSYPFHGKLKLPVLLIHCNTTVYFSNMVTFEMTSGRGYPAITSYANFMKSLIETPKDVKVLLEKGILYSYLGNDEDIVKAFKEINTLGCIDFGVYSKVRRKIDEHCKSKTKTWLSEFFHNYFRSPWTIIGLFAAAFILCLTFLQTIFTIRPAN